jgi:hypothetical protein
VSTDHLPPANEERRVIPFRPRQRAPEDWRWPLRTPGESPVEDLAKYESEETEDDYRHRMKMNVLGLLITIVLMVAGGWLVTTLADMRRNQDCYLSGGRDCTPIKYTPAEHG